MDVLPLSTGPLSESERLLKVTKAMLTAVKNQSFLTGEGRSKQTGQDMGIKAVETKGSKGVLKTRRPAQGLRGGGVRSKNCGAQQFRGNKLGGSICIRRFGGDKQTTNKTLWARLIAYLKKKAKEVVRTQNKKMPPSGGS